MINMNCDQVFQSEYVLARPYSKGEYNKIENIDGEEVQIIRLSEGCPWKHPYCAESFENPEYKVFEIPEITRNQVRILDMNLLCHPEALEIIRELGRIKVNGKTVYYSLQCGVDYRFLTQEIASALKKAHFTNMRFAWDEGYDQAYKVHDGFKMLVHAGYDPKKIEVFMICNWRIPFSECCLKLDTLKVWGCMVSDCWFDNQIRGKVKPIHWTREEIDDFEIRTRNHGIMIRHNGMQVEKLRTKT